MSKFNSRFQHLRINVGADDIRNTAEKPKTNYFRDPNTLRIQSPKNLNTLTNRPVPVIYSSPMTAKNENKNYLVNNFTKEAQAYNPGSVAKNSNSGYLNTMQNKPDRMEMSAKTGKPNLLNLIKSNLRGKNNFENLNNLNNMNNLNTNNNINFQNLNANSNGHGLHNAQNYMSYSGLNAAATPQARNPSNGHHAGATAYNPNYPLTTKSSSVAKENNQFSTLNKNNSNNDNQNLNKANSLNNNDNYNKYVNKNYNSNNLNFVNNAHNTKENLTNGGGYLHSEGNANISYGMNRQGSSGIRGSSNYQNQKGNMNYADNINKNNLEIMQRNLKGLNNNINNSNTNNTNVNNSNNLNILSAKRENYLQQQQHNLIKSERALKSFSPNVKLESAFASEQKKKLLLKNSVKYFSNNNSNINNNNFINASNHGNLTPTALSRPGANANNVSAIHSNKINNNNENSRINYEDRVVHTDSGAAAHTSRKIHNLAGGNSNAVLSPSAHAHRNIAINSNRAAVGAGNNTISNININNSHINVQNHNQNANNNINNLNSPNTANNIDTTNNNGNSSTTANNNANTNTKEAGKPELIDIMKLISTNQPPISLNVLNKKFENFENSKYSTKRLKYIKGYSANTHQGTVRNYNEDRVSIILNVVKPNSFTGDYWPKISIFGIYDGHGGATCADFLRDHLHQYVIRNANFPHNPREAIMQGFENAEKDFLANYALDKNEEVLDRSGSCALMAFIIDDVCYVANTGDSRSILSRKNGEVIEQLTEDHKPSQKGEETRILQAGGKVYQTQTPTQNINLSVLQNSFNIDVNSIGANHVIVGPCRVFPGRLSVSRSFGDVEAKLTKFSGLPGVIVPTPDISCFKIDAEVDYLVLGCDGIYDQLSNKEIVNSIWMTTQENVRLDDIHQQCSLANDFIIKNCLNRKCLDNITLVIVAFENFEKIFEHSNFYPALHTYEDQPVTKKLLGDTVYSTRVVKRPNIEKFTKIRADSHKNYNVPGSSKGSRPKLNNFEDSGLNRDLHNNSLNVKSPQFMVKHLTPINSAKERSLFFDQSNLRSGSKNNYQYGISSKQAMEKVRFIYGNNANSNTIEDKRNSTLNPGRDSLNNSNYVKSNSINRRLLDHSSIKDDSRTLKNDSLISNSFLQRRKNK